MGFYVRHRGGGFSATIDAARVGFAMGAFPDRLATESRRGLRRVGTTWEKRMKRRFRGYTGEPGPTLQVRTGQMRRTIHYRVVPTGKTSLRRLRLKMIVGDGRTPGVLAQEFGAVIRPVHSRALTVPLDDALTPAGVISGAAIIRKSPDGYVTDYGPTFIYRPGGRGSEPAFVAVRTAGGLKLLYVLKQRTVIPGPKTTRSKSRLGALDTAMKTSRDMLVGELAAAARRVWRRKT